MFMGWKNEDFWDINATQDNLYTYCNPYQNYLNNFLQK